jgi:hypothetical protein
MDEWCIGNITECLLFLKEKTKSGNLADHGEIFGVISMMTGTVKDIV